jgi:ABC-type transport system involved in cytochrome bd biosynthesis fused ATPase/permease subunit
MHESSEPRTSGMIMPSAQPILSSITALVIPMLVRCFFLLRLFQLKLHSSLAKQSLKQVRQAVYRALLVLHPAEILLLSSSVSSESVQSTTQYLGRSLVCCVVCWSRTVCFGIEGVPVRRSSLPIIPGGV